MQSQVNHFSWSLSISLACFFRQNYQSSYGKVTAFFNINFWALSAQNPWCLCFTQSDKGLLETGGAVFLSCPKLWFCGVIRESSYIVQTVKKGPFWNILAGNSLFLRSEKGKNFSTLVWKMNSSVLKGSVSQQYSFIFIYLYYNINIIYIYLFICISLFIFMFIYLYIFV